MAWRIAVLDSIAQVGGAEISLLELARLILLETGSKSELVFEPLPQDDPKQRCPDISKARQLLSWEPEVPLHAGLELTLQYFREQLGVLAPAVPGRDTP